MLQQQSLQSRILALFQNLGTLALLAIAFGLNFPVVLLSLVWNFVRQPFQKQVTLTQNPKNILLTGGKMTKALQLARLFHAAGHKVFLVETKKYWLSGHQFSHSVKRFYTVPEPQHDKDGYIQGLLEIVKREKIDIFIPVSSPAASLYDSLAKPVLSQMCEVFHFDADMTQLLDNKFTLSQQAHTLGLTAPKSYLVTDPEQILRFNFEGDRKYLLKSIPYSSVYRLDMVKLPCADMTNYIQSLPISKDHPWMMQEFITGQEYCTHSTVRDGVIKLHCCSKSSAFQVNYEQVDHPQILEWVTHFVKELNLTGQISFDFIQEEDKIYAIECNPRTHSAITMFHDHPGVADAYLSQDVTATPIQPLAHSKPTYWLYHEVWRLTGIRSLPQLQSWINNILRGTDAIFRLDDPLPFLMVHHWQIPLLLLNNLLKLQGWIRIDFNIGKIVQLGGD